MAKRWKTCVDLHANLISTKLSASHRKSTQVHASPDQTKSQVDPSLQLASTYVNLRLRLARALLESLQQCSEIFSNLRKFLENVWQHLCDLQFGESPESGQKFSENHQIQCMPSSVCLYINKKNITHYFEAMSLMFE